MTMAKEKKFKVIEKDAKDAPTKDIEWEGEEVQAESTTKIQEDKGTGQPIILRFFDFAAIKKSLPNTHQQPKNYLMLTEMEWKLCSGLMD
jgi:hypothetical protein